MQTLIVGLGNPGKQYATTRHNIGFAALDCFLKNQQAARWKMMPKLNAEMTQIQVNDQTIGLVKPQTFMNESGRAVQAVLAYYHIPLNNLILVYDDLDLPFGRIKINRNSGSGGHKGVQSVIDRLGTKDFLRLRLGIGSTRKQRIPAEQYVLKRFSLSEKLRLNSVLETSAQALLCLINEGEAACMTKFNQR
jgi:PTH1 family peptidyl-tRNA hydrolase